MNHSFEYFKKLYIIFGTPGAVYSGVFIVDITHVFYTGLGQIYTGAFIVHSTTHARIQRTNSAGQSHYWKGMPWRY